MAIIEVEDVSFSYRPGEPVLQNLRVQFDERSTAVIGQNGAGKTTFVKLLKGLLRPQSGRILLRGRDIAELTVAELARHIGLVFQNPNDQIFKNNVLEEVMFGPLNIGMSKEDAKKKAQEALDMVGLTEVMNINPYDMGNKECA